MKNTHNEILNYSYTWYGPKNKCGKLDRALLNHQWSSSANRTLKGLGRKASDHVCLLLYNTEFQRRKLYILERSFEKSEVLIALEEMDANKAPGPDGFNAKYLKFLWEVMDQDIAVLFNEFHSSAALPTGSKSCFRS
ncbi:hypothetical protein POM88_046288 [Heracleum sosnowskyi]|uniref:Uncharacterized protein n=1 Tax=Heracleum sosnowskyi TaxID=360622 RepID=A0AAD8H8V6_9APIA|nr:hypothetical protein POM88_046288 [Heracleum sosnowskyi]